jgi:hypothetical protein
VRWVDRLDPGSYESKISRWSRRFVEQASCESERGRGVPSSESRASRNVVEAFCSSFWLVPSLWAELLVWFSQGFIFLDR